MAVPAPDGVFADAIATGERRTCGAVAHPVSTVLHGCKHNGRISAWQASIRPSKGVAKATSDPKRQIPEQRIKEPMALELMSREGPPFETVSRCPKMITRLRSWKKGSANR